MEERGSILLSREFLQWEWYEDTNVKLLFIHLHLTVNREYSMWRRIEINRGQRGVVMRDLEAETRLTRQELRTAIDKLKLSNEITAEATKTHTIITVNNYDKYSATLLEIN